MCKQCGEEQAGQHGCPESFDSAFSVMSVCEPWCQLVLHHSLPGSMGAPSLLEQLKTCSLTSPRSSHTDHR